ncbi:MAG: lipid-A-disaccharide synthase [Candidatus Marinimicrobia bacterium]|nr:lipid-A-disaccharide synthase [Candidatus Neomarinimicrobiota bacterium]
MNSKIKTVFIVAGEPSGDIHAAKLVSALKGLSPKTKFFGNGGDKMAESGVKIIHHINDLSIMGFVEVIKHFPRLLRIMKETLSAIKNINPDRIILVDYPGFNLRLAKKIKNLNMDIPVTYFILPQLWAWKENRLKIMEKTIDQSVSIFPFESEWFKSKGLNTFYAGHPFIEREYNTDNKTNFFNKHNFSQNRPVLILLPGSRQQEIDYHWPIFLSTVSTLNKKLPGLQTIVIKSSNIKLAPVPEHIKVEPSSKSVIQYGTAAISSSGTATLECALAALPTVVCYKMSYFNWILFNFFGKVKYISIVNLIANKKIIPELIQNKMIPKNIMKKIYPYLDIKSNKRKTTLKNFNNLRKTLGSPGVFDRIAKIIIHRN